MTVRMLLVAVLLVGCGAAIRTPGVVKTLEEPLHAESGVGVSVWKVPLVGLGFWGFGPYSYGQTVVYAYNYQAVPPPTTPSGIPTELPGAPQPVVPPGASVPPAPGVPPPVEFKTTYSRLRGVVDDPTLVVFQNQSRRATFRVSVVSDPSRSELTLLPGQSSPDVHFSSGEWKIRVRGEIPTAHPDYPTLPIEERTITIRVEARGRPQTVSLHE